VDKKFEKDLNKLEVDFRPELAEQLGIELDDKQKARLAAKQAAAAAATPAPTQDSTNPTPDPDAAFVFSDPDQLISLQTSYLMTHLLKGVVLEGTGFRAKALNRPSAGKTGTTSGYYDAWYIGFTPQIATGVWVGFDDQRSLGRLETGNSAALPAWVDYMMAAVQDTPALDFSVPPGIVFANIDAETGRLASIKSKKAVREAFREGSEPNSSAPDAGSGGEKNFFKEDLSD
jgi:penicillin-binding protein 1A